MLPRSAQRKSSFGLTGTWRVATRAKDELGDGALPEVLSYADGIQFEKVAALKPDLIVGMYSALTKEDYSTLSKIAPTIGQPKGNTIDWAASWQEVTTTVGRAVGESAKAGALVKDTNALLAKYAADNPSFKGKTGLVATPYEGFYVYGAHDPRGLLLQSLGFVMPAGLDKVSGKEFGGNLSKERTDLLDVDALIWLLDKYAAGQEEDRLERAVHRAGRAQAGPRHLRRRGQAEGLLRCDLVHHRVEPANAVGGLGAAAGGSGGRGGRPPPCRWSRRCPRRHRLTCRGRRCRATGKRSSRPPTELSASRCCGCGP